MLIIILSILSIASSDDYYKLLGVDKHADDKTIKKSFKKLSLEFHPDRGNSQTQDHYMKLSLAYEVLTNPAKREVYDKFGEEGITIGGLKYNVEEIYDNYFGVNYPGKNRWYNFLFRGTGVVELTEQNMNSLNNRNSMWIVQFYGTKSRKSREFTGVWNNLANRMENFAKVAAVNCDVNEDMCREHNVKKYPVFVLFPANKDESPIPYTGSKDYRSLNDFMITNLPGSLESLTASTFYQFLSSNPEKAKIILFCENKESWPITKQVSFSLADQVLFGEVRNTEKDLVQKYQIDSFPTLIVITNKGHEKYQGAYNKKSIEEWARAKAKQHVVVSLAPELDDESIALGNCGKNDGKFCFIAMDPDSRMQELLNELITQFVNDPVSIFWMSSKKYPQVLSKVGSKNFILRGKKAKLGKVKCQEERIECFAGSIVGALNDAWEFEKVKDGLGFDVRTEL